MGGRLSDSRWSSGGAVWSRALPLREFLSDLIRRELTVVRVPKIGLIQPTVFRTSENIGKTMDVRRNLVRV